MFQSLGINNPKINAQRTKLAAAVAGLVLVGNLSFPITVQAGLVDFEICSNADATVAQQVEDNCVVEASHSEDEDDSQRESDAETDSELEVDEITELEGAS